MLRQKSGGFIGTGTGTGEFTGTVCGVPGTGILSFSAVATPTTGCFEFTWQFKGTSGGLLGARGAGRGTGPFLGCEGSTEGKVILK